MGKPIHVDIKRAAVRMSEIFSVKEIAYFLDISDDTVRRAIQLYEESGDVVKPKSDVKRGRKPILNSNMQQVSAFTALLEIYCQIDFIFKVSKRNS